ncbi:MAG TPA: TolC family protein [Candidatus Sulfotelmatobacter sp.]|jgi:outer membrane protein TolC|nr:TolC family protein [Candidatus Sulfotelmatobacter sp.]
MPFARIASNIRLATAALLFGMLTVAGWAQEPPPAAPAPQNSPDARPLPVLNYSQPVSHFPNPVGPYTPRHVAPPNLANSSRIDSLMHDGRVYLSLNDAIALALENNLDVAIARYNLNIADTDVLRAKAGATILGVNAGVVQNTPGGGVGGIGATAGASTGGTSLGAGGIGAGTNGLVSSTLGQGPLIASFDPVITGTLQEDHAESVSSSLFNGVPILAQNTGTVNFNYTQGFSWGTNVQVGFTNNRITSNVPFNTYSPVINSALRLQVTQHLLQGFGFPSNTRFIHIAKNNRELSDVAFRLQIIDSVDQIENIYWDLVYAFENARVQNESLAFAQKTLSDTKKQVEIGSLAPIETVRAQSTVAQDQQLVTLAQTNLQLEQLLMKNALTRTLKDPTLATAEVIPTSTIDFPAQEEIVPTEDLINQALRHRAELVESRIDLNSRDYSNKAVRSALLPTLDAFAYYAGSGLGGSQSPANLCANQTAEQRLLGFCAGPNPDDNNQTLIPTVGSTSIGGTWNQLVNSTAPDKGVGLQLNIPLRNRAAQSLQIRSELEYRQAQMRLQQIENQVGIEVRNAQYAVQQNRASVDSAKAALDLARQSLDAEQKKYQFGTSTTTLVLQYESQLATAESTLVNATVAYEKSRIELDRSTGTLLDHNGISLDDAARGQVTRMPNVPYIAPRKELPSVAQPAPQATVPQQPQ